MIEKVVENKSFDDFWVRPQTPKKPLPYRTQEVEYFCKNSGYGLLGTLTTPHVELGSVVFVPGFGIQDRDSTISGHKIFFVLSDFFTKLGFSTLRYDFPCNSSVSCASAESLLLQEGFAMASIECAVNLTKGPVIGFGHSCGGRVLLSIADKASLMSSCILMSTPIGSLHSCLIYQYNCLFDEYGLCLQDKNRRLRELTSSFKIDDNIDLYDAKSEQRGRSFSSEVYAQAMNASLEEYVSACEIPTLYLYGNNDCQVDVKVEANLVTRFSNKSKTKLITYSALNHLLQPSEIKSTSEYRTTQITISELVLTDISSWLQACGFPKIENRLSSVSDK